jgi:ABC-2 type transport system permease protein
VNLFLVQKLIAKDWYFQRSSLIGFLLAGVVLVLLLGVPSEIWFAVGGIGLLTLTITVGALLVSTTIVGERSSQTLVFLMGLPISMREYTTAKLLGNFLIFFVPWLTLLFATVLVITNRPNLPDGLVAYALIVLVQLLINFCLVLCAALTTESQAGVTVAILLGNLALQAFLMLIPARAEIRGIINGASIAWNSSLSLILGLQVGLIVLLLIGTFLLQMRKTNFL